MTRRDNMKYTTILLLFTTALITGCIGTGYEETYAPDGTKLYRAYCNGRIRSMAKCYDIAHSVCGDKGFKVHGANEHDRVSPNWGAGFSATAPQYNTRVDRELWFQCGGEG